MITARNMNYKGNESNVPYKYKHINNAYTKEKNEKLLLWYGG